MEYKNLPKQIKSPITGNLLQLQKKPENGCSILGLCEKDSSDDNAIYYCGDFVGVYFNEITKEYLFYA